MKKHNTKIKRIAIISACLATILGISIGLGVTYNIDAGTTNPITNVPPLEPGMNLPSINVSDDALQFDENDQPIISEIEDPEYPTGDYEFKIEETNLDEIIGEKNVNFNESVTLSDTEINLSEIRDDTKTSLFENVGQEFLDKTITVDARISNLVEYFIPEIDLDVGETISMEGLGNKLFETAIEKYSNENMSTSEVRELLAINGVSLDSEYNKIMSIEEATQISNYNQLGIDLHMGGGVRPPPNFVPPEATQPDYVVGVKVSEVTGELRAVLIVRMAVNVIFSAAIVMVSVWCLVNAFYTLGVSLILYVADLIYSGYEYVQTIWEIITLTALITDWTRFSASVIDLLGDISVSDINQSALLLGTMGMVIIANSDSCKNTILSLINSGKSVYDKISAMRPILTGTLRLVRRTVLLLFDTYLTYLLHDMENNKQ